MATDLEAQYRRYIDCLNARRISDLADFVHDELTYNGQPLTRQDYEKAREEDYARAPNLRFDIDLLVANGTYVGARISFNDIVLAQPFLGRPVDGKPVSFVEHVFYEFEEGKIRKVWSVLEADRLRSQ